MGFELNLIEVKLVQGKTIFESLRLGETLYSQLIS